MRNEKWSWGEKNHRRMWTKKEFNALIGCECRWADQEAPDFGICRFAGTEFPKGYDCDNMFFIVEKDGNHVGEDLYSFHEDYEWRKDKDSEWMPCGVEVD